MDPDDNIRPCGRRDDDTYILGNINADDFRTIVDSPNRQLFALDRSRVREHCGECRHYAICHGGCTTSAYMARQNMADPDSYCESYMALFDHIKSVVPKMIESPKDSELTHLETSISQTDCEVSAV